MKNQNSYYTTSRSRLFSLRMPYSDLHNVNQAANDAGQSVSEYIRLAVKEKIEKFEDIHTTEDHGAVL